MDRQRAVVGRLIAFKNDKEYASKDGVGVELTEVEHDRVELAFDMPGKLRVYIQVSLADLIREAMRDRRDTEAA